MFRLNLLQLPQLHADICRQVLGRHRDWGRRPAFWLHGAHDVRTRTRGQRTQGIFRDGFSGCRCSHTRWGPCQRARVTLVLEFRRVPERRLCGAGASARGGAVSGGAGAADGGRPGARFGSDLGVDITDVGFEEALDAGEHRGRVYGVWCGRWGGDVRELEVLGCWELRRYAICDHRRDPALSRRAPRLPRADPRVITRRRRTEYSCPQERGKDRAQSGERGQTEKRGESLSLVGERHVCQCPFGRLRQNLPTASSRIETLHVAILIETTGGGSA